MTDINNMFHILRADLIPMRMLLDLEFSAVVKTYFLYYTINTSSNSTIVSILGNENEWV